MIVERNIVEVEQQSPNYKLIGHIAGTSTFIFIIRSTGVVLVGTSKFCTRAVRALQSGRI